MELEVKESVSIEDGKHEGVVVSVEDRHEPYEYTDIFIEESKTHFNLKVGCPTNPSMGSKLMKLLSRFTEIKPGMKVDPAKIMVGKPVEFMTMQEDGKDGKTYTRIVEGSVKPKEGVSCEVIDD